MLMWNVVICEKVNIVFTDVLALTSTREVEDILLMNGIYCEYLRKHYKDIK